MSSYYPTSMTNSLLKSSRELRNMNVIWKDRRNNHNLKYQRLMINKSKIVTAFNIIRNNIIFLLHVYLAKTRG